MRDGFDSVVYDDEGEPSYTSLIGSRALVYKDVYSSAVVSWHLGRSWWYVLLFQCKVVSGFSCTVCNVPGYGHQLRIDVLYRAVHRKDVLTTITSILEHETMLQAVSRHEVIFKGTCLLEWYRSCCRIEWE